MAKNQEEKKEKRFQSIIAAILLLLFTTFCTGVYIVYGENWFAGWFGLKVPGKDVNLPLENRISIDKPFETKIEGIGKGKLLPGLDADTPDDIGLFAFQCQVLIAAEDADKKFDLVIVGLEFKFDGVDLQKPNDKEYQDTKEMKLMWGNDFATKNKEDYIESVYLSFLKNFRICFGPYVDLEAESSGLEEGLVLATNLTAANNGRYTVTMWANDEIFFLAREGALFFDISLVAK